MTTSDRFRGSTIEVRRQRDGKPELRINDRVMDVYPDPDIPGMLRSEYAYYPAATVEELGQHIIDTQMALTEPLLDGIRPEAEDAS